jgi:hypothetical protein
MMGATAGLHLFHPSSWTPPVGRSEGNGTKLLHFTLLFSSTRAFFFQGPPPSGGSITEKGAVAPANVR